MAEDGGLDVRHGGLELAITGAFGLFEQRGSYAGDDLPAQRALPKHQRAS